MVRISFIGALVWWPAAAMATCPVPTPPPQMAKAQDGLPYVGIMLPVPAGQTYQTCPEDVNGEYKRGLLFGVSDDDCPQGCASSDRPVTVELLDPGAADTASMIATSQSLPAQLARYCIYVPTRSGSAPPVFPAGVLVADLAQPSVLAVAASGLQEDLLQYHADLTQEHVDYCPVASPAGPPRLALLDTAVTASQAKGNDRALHGNTLARLLEDLACDGGPCPFELYTRSALPVVALGPPPEWDVVDGGHYGPLDWLAQSVVREMEAWALSGEPNLVLNLSLAWHEDWGGSLYAQGLGECERPDVSAVYDALRYARCSGALILASAGNRTAGATDTGDVFPGAWANEAVTQQDCLSDFGIANAPVMSPDGSPLVFSVGGVSDDDEPITLARPDGLPHLVAYADHVTDGATVAITGTSVATALVSAEAARIWSEDPQRTADQVMDEVWVRAAPTTITTTGPYAGFGYFGSTEARRVASCATPGSVSPPRWPVVPSTSLPLVAQWADPFVGLEPTGGYLAFATPTPVVILCPTCAFLVPERKLNYDITGYSPTGTIQLALFTSTAVGAPADQIFDLGTATSGVVEIQNSVAPKRAVLLFESTGEGEDVSYIAEVKVSQREQ